MRDDSSQIETRVRGAPQPNRIRWKRVFIPWLLFVGVGTGLYFEVRHELRSRRALRAELSAAREETAEVRRQLFVTEEKLKRTESERESSLKAAVELSQKMSALRAEEAAKTEKKK